MKILVTGANGFLGRGIVSQLLNLGNEVVATDRSTQLVTDLAQRVDADLFSVDDPYNFFGQPDAVLHLAYRNGFVLNAETHLEDLALHANFIKLLVEGGIKKVAIMGTMHEIGFHEGSVDETTPTNPMNFYGIAKNALRDYTKIVTNQAGVQMQWLRAYYIVENTAYGNSIFSKLYQADENGDSEFPFTSGKTQYDFLDYADFANYVAHVVSQNDIDGIINISSGEPVSLSSRVERFIKENNLTIKLAYGKFPDRPFDPKAIWGNNQKLNMIMNEEN
ncbi:NAD(P)-dependent oxidoreductase [Weissella diestrammenae]|uniref:NAD(P)-dependent oxidoreductase n=1 Tax=Weissella diestrammenae TaxID=1162633 RepID=A0A7G9T520_9LACO|nr:NAD(P)-dependent oxidoreductase [Weissella diestrammenae]MCM0582918.1 NAD(P)-dependent oxidoreductase [Weissella diestrammenae]QNN75195.1 NAD(P)-dependent oxidoreductase [Weissella diestrammenae]